MRRMLTNSMKKKPVIKLLYTITFFDLKAMDTQQGRKCTSKHGNSSFQHISKPDLEIFTWSQFRIP